MIKDYYNFIKLNAVLFTNYLLIIYAFFLPLSKELSNIAFSFVLILFLIDGHFKEKILFILKDKVVVSILIFVLMHFVWLIGTDDFSYARDKLSFMKYFLSIILFVTVVKKEFIMKIISAFVLAMLISEVCSYLIFFHIIEPFNNATQINPVPFMLNHGFYATFLSLAFGIVLYSIFKKEVGLSHWSRIVALIFSVTITLNIFIISSRLGYILFFTVLFTMLILFFKKQLLKFFLLFILLSSTGYLFAYSNIPNFKNRVHEAYQDINQIIQNQNYDTSFGARFGFHILSINIIHDSFLFGVGTGDHINYMKEQIEKFENKTTNEMLRVIGSSTGVTLHSDYLDVFVQFGLIGLVIFLNIFYQVIIYHQTDKYLKALQILVIVVILVSAISQGMIYFTPLNKVFILLIALTLSLYQDKKVIDI